MLQSDDATPPDEPRSSRGHDPRIVLHPGDLQLVQAVLRREPAALEQFGARVACAHRFVALCNGQLGRVLRADELEDAAQSAIATVWHKLDSYRGEASLETWVFRFCDFEVRNAGRRAMRRRAPSLDEVAEPKQDGAPVEAAVDDADQVHAAIARLPADEAVVVQLKHFQALTFDAIGTNLGCSANTVKTRYYRAIAALRHHLRAAADR